MQGWWWWWWASALLFVACGGGGGGDPAAKSPSSPSSSPSGSPSASMATSSSTGATEDDPPPPPSPKGDPNGKIEIVTVSQYGRISLGSDIVVDDTHLYWASAGVGISRLSKSADKPAEVIAPVPRDESVTLIAAGGTHIAWATNDAMKPGHAAIHVRDSKSGTVTTVAKNLAMPIAMTVDHAHVYFATMGGVAGDSPPTAEPGMIRRARLSTGVVEVVQRGIEGATSLAVDATHLYTISARATTTSYADLIRVPKKGGGTIEMLAKAQDTPVGLALDDQFVYFATGGPIEMPPPVPCKTPPCPVATSAPVMQHGSLRRVSKTARDETPTTIAVDLNAPKVVGANAAFVVFRQGSGIFTLPKTGAKSVAPIRLIDWSTQRLAQVSFEGFTYVPREDKIYVIGRRKES